LLCQSVGMGPVRPRVRPDEGRAEAAAKSLLHVAARVTRLKSAGNESFGWGSNRQWTRIDANLEAGGAATEIGIYHLEHKEFYCGPEGREQTRTTRILQKATK
jgi:hypothetical protein